MQAGTRSLKELQKLEKLFSFDPIKNLTGEFQTLLFQKYI